MIDKDVVINHIDYGIECDYLDFKSDIYDFQNQFVKEDFIVDVMSFANAHCKDDKYIITGVKLDKIGTKKLNGIDISKVQDGADYQSLITNNIEPTIIVDFNIVDYGGNQFGVFKIAKENRDRPYCLSKQYCKLQKGFTRIRKGQQNVEVLRKDYDLFYKEKEETNQSDIHVKGFTDGKKTDTFELKKYKPIFDNTNSQNFIKKKIDKVNSIVVSSRSNSPCMLGTYATISDDEKQLIENYANSNNIALNSDFFKLGNLNYFNTPFTSTTFYGTDDEKIKYDLLNEISDDIIGYLSREKFMKEMTDLYYTELVIDNIGKIFDEDIEVCLTIPKKGFLKFRDFPVPYGKAIDTVIDNNVLNYFMGIEKNKNVSQYREKDRRINPIAPTSYKLPIGGWAAPDYESKREYYYELIECEADYEIIETDDEIILKYLQKDIKPNETITFPSKIVFTDLIDKIEYTVKTKHNPNVMSGEIKSKKND